VNLAHGVVEGGISRVGSAESAGGGAQTQFKFSFVLIGAQE
jgi:hypothetical protein